MIETLEGASNGYRKKINLQKVLALLNTTCTLCGYSIRPGESLRLDSERMLCPNCKKPFKGESKK